jgi:hypothetical protein
MDATLIRDFLSQDLLAKAEAELRLRESRARFSTYLSGEGNDLFLRALHKFVRSAPWRYWDQDVVDAALGILDRSVERTASAMSVRARQVGIGFENLFRRSPTAAYEEKLNLSKISDLLRLATEFHPEYLRCAEHIFSNLLTLYWSVLKRDDVQGRYDLRGAVNLISQKGHGFLLAGYDDDIRNAIAHGEVVFRGLETIRYGPEVADVNLASFEFMAKFDSLWRTSNNLAIATLLFIARNKRALTDTYGVILPPSVMAFLAAGAVERTGLNVVGVVESEIHGVGKQLHLAVETATRSRLQVLLECAQLTMHLLDSGGGGYARYLFQIDQGKSLSSLVIVKPDKLKTLLDESASTERIGEIFGDTPLLWYDESQFRTKLKGWLTIMRSHLRLAREEIRAQWRAAGVISPGSGRYVIRKIENASAGRIPRVNVIAVLRYPEDAGDREMVRQIIRGAIKDASKVWVDTKAVGLEGERGRIGRPRYIWLRLCKLDGTIRWLNAAGWSSGNLVAIAEMVYGFRRQPILVRRPEEVWREIRILYSSPIVAVSENSEDTW